MSCATRTSAEEGEENGWAPNRPTQNRTEAAVAAQILQRPLGEEVNNVEKLKDEAVEPSDNRIRRRDTRNAVANFCKAHGGGLMVGAELQFDSDECGERGQDFWFGFELINSGGVKRGEASVGYVRCDFEFRIYAAIELDGEEVAVRSIALDRLATSQRNDGRTQPRELKALLIEVADHATRKILEKRGVAASA
jgi:hypothetical protein